jgi:uncharacterized protein
MRLLLTVVILSTAGWGLVGCASTQPSRFYVLSDLQRLETAQQGAPAEQGPVIGIGPMAFPKYLDRPHIVTLASRYGLTLSEFERWAEPFEGNFARALADHLSTMIPTDRLAMYPWPPGTPIDYQVTIEVVHFVGQLSGASTLLAQWSLVGGEGKGALISRRSRLTAQAAGQGYEALVAAMGQTVAALSGEIAAAIKTLARPAPAR